MKVYNLTDIHTETLMQRGLVGKQIALSGRLVNPGEFVEVSDTPTARANLQYLLQVGAVAIDRLPPPYVLARQQSAASSGRLSPSIAQRVELQETKTAGEPPPGPPADGEEVRLEKVPTPVPPPLPIPEEDPPPMKPPMAAMPSKSKKSSR